MNLELMYIPTLNRVHLYDNDNRIKPVKCGNLFRSLFPKVYNAFIALNEEPSSYVVQHEARCYYLCDAIFLFQESKTFASHALYVHSC